MESWKPSALSMRPAAATARFCSTPSVDSGASDRTGRSRARACGRGTAGRSRRGPPREVEEEEGCTAARGRSTGTRKQVGELKAAARKTIVALSSEDQLPSQLAYLAHQDGSAHSAMAMRSNTRSTIVAQLSCWGHNRT